MKVLNAALLLIGLGVLALLIWHVGSGDLVKEVRAVGWGVVALILTEGIGNVAHTIGWQHCISRNGQRIPWWRLFRIAMAGYAVNYLLPMASVGGEATKAALLSSSRTAAESVSSVLLDKLATGIGHLLLAVAGAALIFSYARLPWKLLVAMGASTLLLAVGLGAFLLIQRYGKLGALLRWITDRKWGGELARNASRRISAVDEALQQFYRERPKDFAIAIGWHLLGHSVALVHAWVFLWWLGKPAPLVQVACAGMLSLWFDLLTFAVPLNLGALEGGRMVALEAIGSNASLGMAFGLSIRMAQLFWVFFGMLNQLLFTIRQTAAPPACSMTKQSG